MPSDCVVRSCKSNGGDLVSFHRIPKNSELRRVWLHNINRRNWIPKEWARVCGKHFVEGRPTKSNALPVLLMDCDQIISRFDTSADELRISSVIDSVINNFSAPMDTSALSDLVSTADNTGTNGETDTLLCGLRDSDWSPLITRVASSGEKRSAHSLEKLSTATPQRIENRPRPQMSTSIGTNTDECGSEMSRKRKRRMSFNSPSQLVRLQMCGGRPLLVVQSSQQPSNQMRFIVKQSPSPRLQLQHNGSQLFRLPTPSLNVTVDQQQQNAQHRTELRLKEAKEQALNGFISLATYCSELVKEQSHNGVLKCNLCGYLTRISPTDNKQKCCDMLANHAATHGGRPPLYCRLCAYNSASLTDLRDRARRAQQNPPLCTVNIVGFHGLSVQRLIVLIDQCYGGAFIVQRQRPNRRSSSEVAESLYLHTRQVLGPDAIRKSEVTCKLCSKTLVVINGKGKQMANLFEHAVGHLRLPIYSCQLCSYTSSIKMEMVGHARCRHGYLLSSSTELFFTNIDLYTEEINSIIEQCFRQDNDSSHFPKAITAATLDLIVKYAKDRKLDCLICKKRMDVHWDKLKVRTQFAIDHAAKHLGQLLYFCRLCHVAKFGLLNILAHGRMRHSGHGFKGWSFTNKSNEHEKELREMLTKCYDRGQANLGLKANDGGKVVNIPKHKSTKLNQHGRISQQNRNLWKKFGRDYQPALKVKYVRWKVPHFRCPQCPMISKYKMLVERHVKIYHTKPVIKSETFEWI